MIQVLVRKLSAYGRLLQSVSGSDWNTLLQLAHTSYRVGSYWGLRRQQVTEILEAARKACISRSSFEDEEYMHVAKKLRLEA